MALSNDMTRLLNKIERRLGTRQLQLPKELSKPEWVNVINEETLETFSRYFPHALKVEINEIASKKGEYWIIDEDKIGPGVKILGVKDIAWDEPKNSAIFGAYGYGITDWYVQPMDLESIVGLQNAADNISMYNNGIYLDFEYPNKIALKSSFNIDVTKQWNSFYLWIFVKHINLQTIAPTKMEIFERLAIADVATFLYEELKYYDGLETVFANVDIKLDDLRTKAESRTEVIDILESSYVSFANKNQPMIFTF